MAGPSSQAAAAPATALPDGFPRVFGKYVLLRPMAKGGMGELFLAVAGETGGFEKLCVLKKVLHNLEDPAVHRRFLDEAKVVVRLNHGNLVQVFDAGQVDQEHYLAMELVEGKDLRAVWNRCAQLHRRIPVDFAIYVIREVARGLSYVHDVGGLDLVHRDISPPNILIGYHGGIKLTDFGLAKSALKREMTSPGVVFGRYSYLAPEQARGLPADRRTDIYAAGIVLWELLTGRQLFPTGDRTHREALAAVRNPTVQPPSKVVPGIPPGLDAVVLKALARSPDDRYQSAGQFRAAMSEILARDFPACDTDRVSEFMRDIFTGERKSEGQEYADLGRRDFGPLRATAQPSRAISISDVASADGSIELVDNDIVELDRDTNPGDVRIDLDELRLSAEQRVGAVIAQRYRLEDLLGVGGMGAVFRAQHLALGRAFALKILHRVYSNDADIITRFMREARAATQTGHPNIIDVIDIGTMESGDVFFVMELLQGQDVGQTIRAEGPLAIRRAVHIARQICRALSAAHEVGIVHRDLKSENVVLVARGQDTDSVKVLDFGICKQEETDTRSTRPGLVMGSPDYMAPEQARGLPATPLADVYAVGCILFEMLTGRVPFVGRTAMDVMMQKAAQDAPDVRSLRPEVPAGLADVVSRCLARTPEVRPASMRVLEYELTRAVDGRATAVAAVLGLDVPQDGEPGGSPAYEPTSASSISLQRAAVAAAGNPMHESAADHPVRALAGAGRVPSDGASDPTAGAPAAGRASTLATAARAIGFIVLGGALAVGVMIAVSPDGLDGVLARVGLAEPVAGDEPAVRGVEPPPATVPGDAAPALGTTGSTAPPDPLDSATMPPTATVEPADTLAPKDEPAVDPTDAAVTTTSGGDPAPAGDDPAALVALAEAALAAEHWREPAEGSLALTLVRLSLLDPSHEALTRLRKDALAKLRPALDGARKAKDWNVAIARARDVLAIRTDDEAARELLIDGLRRQGRIAARAKDHALCLATADELLNLEGRDYTVLVWRADALAGLERWADAVDAYVEARKLRPRDKELKKRQFVALRQLRAGASAGTGAEGEAPNGDGGDGDAGELVAP